ncbi:hypothetical protein [Lederbergia citrea]|uniref:Uncharacterized protein n=1 Tax=Lederbergia citrea TaxID=2833581 RepID=A0A942USS9_9BACI|nr:hypothetical protein [Lederbergia citrea]MBS4176488.1 hypothetical protein [Lederbergia citrea]MBS4222279.1 hypothetical protein [Lederbergia citrea]
MKKLKETSIVIVILLLIFSNLKLINTTKQLNKEIHTKNQTILTSFNVSSYSVLKTLNTSLSNNELYIGKNGFVINYLKKDIREMNNAILDLSNNVEGNNRVDLLPLVNILDSFSVFLGSLYTHHKGHLENSNEQEQYIDLDSNKIEGIIVIKETIADLINIQNSVEGNKDRWIKILEELTHYSNNKDLEDKRLKIEKINKSLTKG